MKKSFLRKISLVSIMTISVLSFRVSASDLEIDSKKHLSQSKEVKVNFNIPDSYTFTIPESINIDYPSLEGDISIKVDNSHLPKDYAINIMIKGKNNEFEFTSSEGNRIPYKLIDEGNKEIISGSVAAKFSNEKVNANEKKLKIIVDEKDIVYAGDYSDSMIFDVEINKIS